jgi:parallel beta-helix repeat protein
MLMKFGVTWLVLLLLGGATTQPSTRVARSPLLEQERAKAKLTMPARRTIRPAATYYVASTGDDRGSGSIDAPFRSLQHAADVVHSGDTVRVRRGTYVGFNLNCAGGTEGNPITFTGGPSVTITASAKSGVNADSGINVEHPGGTAWLVISDFNISDSAHTMSRAGIRLTGCRHVDVLNCTVDNRGGEWGIFVSRSSDLLIQNNVCRNAAGQHGIYISRGSQHIIIRHNVLCDNNWDGLHLNGGADGPIDHCLIEGNIIRRNRLSGIDCDGVRNSIFLNNVVDENGKHAVTFYNHDTAIGCTNNSILNNTLISGSMFAIQMKAGSTCNTIYNNILMATGSAIYGSIGITGIPTGLKCDYNVVVDNFSADLGVSRMTLVEWQHQTMQDRHSIIASAADLFANPIDHDYRLRDGSPAIGAGVCVPHRCGVPLTDIEGRLRPSGMREDIGAYEAAPSKRLPVGGASSGG